MVSKPPIRRPKSFLRVSSSPIFPTNTLLPEDKRLLQGTLSNGLKYYLLPSQQHLRCASYLEILTGSANEKDKECGMAHFVEHLVYTPTIAQVDSHQIKTNAFTDFHQTVFYATDCPSDSLPDLCDSLARIFDNPLQVYSDSDIESEKLDVLSEMGQIDTPRSRVDSQIFCCLHSENILSKRLPIGQRELIQSWSRQDLLDFYHRHYHPQNANLYISGNFEAKSLAKLLQKKLSRVSPQGVTRVEEPNSLRALNRHFPPVIHRWAGRDQSKRLLNPEMKNASATVTILPSSSANEVTIHFFAKTPLLPITTVQDLRREVIRKLIQRAFQTR